MANKVIPLHDKQLVIERIAQGQSTRQAIQGTAIKSNSTAAQLAKREANAIAQHREQYLELIEGLCVLDMADRARLWGEMAHATKFIDKSMVVNSRLRDKEFYMYLARENAHYVDEVPDWQARYKALKHIDELAERVHGANRTVGKLQVNLIKDSENLTINNYK
jgi:hypothetical protein